ncbi:unnamed protein product [Bursaphelenchus okinawaensis]|uniref:Uncharacterized protein n=1 Tax=Bursaphelenchus okinawaensis TaxID=465554 RepID=A0A811KJN7_9BILA|nr:unnamed protein product [Bursaphelenchus okinawaensis]CAG9104318.1 unnamed protein product [Bursaphelenchus okinawaensis]
MVFLSLLRSSSNVFKQEISDLNHVARNLISLKSSGNDTFLANCLLPGRMSLKAIYGGQYVALQLRAACMTVSEGMLPHSTHSYFLQSGTVEAPITVNIKKVRDGQSFCNRYMETVQKGRSEERLLCSGVTSFHVDEPPAVRHLKPFKPYVDPESLLTWEDGIKDGLNDPNITPFHRKLLEWKLKNTPRLFSRIFDIRTTDVPRWTMRTRHPPDVAPEHQGFIKCNFSPGDGQVDHRVMASFMGDIVMMEGALVDHINHGFFPTMLFSIDQSVYFHTDINVNEWMFFDVQSPVADNGRIFAECKVWSLDGRLLMTNTQEGLVRYDQSHPNSQAPT